MTAINISPFASSLTGSSFDWQSFVDTMMSYQSTTITTLKAEQSVNTDKVSGLNIIKSYMQDLQTKTKALTSSSLFGGRTVSSTTSGSNWTLSAATNTATGAYTFNVSQLATSSKRTGSADISSPLHNSDNVSTLTLAAMPTATAVTAGTFTVNGATVTIALEDSLQDVFTKINVATGGAVTGSYSTATDKITLSSGSEIVLGGANDTSNFLAATQLANNGTGSLSSTNALGSARINSPLASARLRSAITAVDGSGNGSFSLNGVAIAYNVNSDSLSSIITRINASSAGVTASYDSALDRMVLVNKSTGDMGFGLSETAGGFLDAVGLSMTSSGAATSRGKNALFTVNDGSTLTSMSNTLDSSVTGITGLSVKAGTTGTQTINVSSDTASMKSAIQAFIDSYNVVQSNIDLQTSIEQIDGTLTTSTLTSVREVGQWSSSLRSKVFASVSGLSGTISRLADMGIDFNGTSNLLTIRDSTKLENALTNKTADVEAFFNNATNGFTSVINNYITNIAGTTTSGSSVISKMTDRLLSNNLSIDKQISLINRQLESERARMITSFQAMQTAQSNAKSMVDTLKNLMDSMNGNNN